MRRFLTVSAGIALAALALFLSACTLKHLTFYVGGLDYGLDLVVGHEGYVESAPGGYLFDAGRLVDENNPYQVILSSFAGADPRHVGFVRSLIGAHPRFEKRAPHFEPTTIYDPGAVAWIESCEWYVEESELFAAAQYLRSRAGAARRAWDEAAAPRTGITAVGGWGALRVTVEDGCFSTVEYQSADSPTRAALDGWGVIGAYEEYAEDSGAEARVAAVLLDENPPQLKGTYTLGAAFRLY
ncbi:MAG: hypothetical protein A2Y64_03400 [Candidatus Coatesbacteria bacterium RBG_13_66_14]|uniref:Uncharacterized protein n=1 Tax=Candidatus Coatesbacteria bacterium RBG_13_66_14 TaxID=1817816 RepID=A0A1F5EVR6_9BACT|nr:MAG: hypothetical protein A2Y64_03400 [Candidatus Coatesbacteria bacterium RBG_13_66_14]